MSFKGIGNGRLGADAVVRETKGGNLVTFNIATDRSKNDPRGAMWITVNCWGDVASNIVEYLKKGTLVDVVGRLDTNEYTTKDGEKRTSLVLHAHSVEFINTGRRNQDGDDNSSSRGNSGGGWDQEEDLSEAAVW